MTSRDYQSTADGTPRRLQLGGPGGERDTTPGIEAELRRGGALRYKRQFLFPTVSPVERPPPLDRCAQCRALEWAWRAWRRNRTGAALSWNSALGCLAAGVWRADCVRLRGFWVVSKTHNKAGRCRAVPDRATVTHRNSHTHAELDGRAGGHSPLPLSGGPVARH